MIGLAAISIHALLAESDCNLFAAHLPNGQFLSTLSLRRATTFSAFNPPCPLFLSTLSLRRATLHNVNIDPLGGISIHALLAESDWRMPRHSWWQLYFYPRSPCGERLGFAYDGDDHDIISIHALLAESDCDSIDIEVNARDISIHALLAESDRTRS